jgi:negative regulator of sigma E activity
MEESASPLFALAGEVAVAAAVVVAAAVSVRVPAAASSGIAASRRPLNPNIDITSPCRSG